MRYVFRETEVRYAVYNRPGAIPIGFIEGMDTPEPKFVTIGKQWLTAKELEEIAFKVATLPAKPSA